MNLSVIAVGKIKEPYFNDAVNEYATRIRAFGTVSSLDFVDIREDTVKHSRQSEQAIISKLKSTDFTVALCIEGTRLTSEKLAEKVELVRMSQKKGMTFIIGGSDGLPGSVKAAADFKLSMSDMTFPHRLAKVMLLEQIYRALTILDNLKYHK